MNGKSWANAGRVRAGPRLGAPDRGRGERKRRRRGCPYWAGACVERRRRRWLAAARATPPALWGRVPAPQRGAGRPAAPRAAARDRAPAGGPPAPPWHKRRGRRRYPRPGPAANRGKPARAPARPITPADRWGEYRSPAARRTMHEKTGTGTGHRNRAKRWGSRAAVGGRARAAGLGGCGHRYRRLPGRHIRPVTAARTGRYHTRRQPGRLARQRRAVPGQQPRPQDTNGSFHAA
jgi:hypothetical protein